MHADFIIDKNVAKANTLVLLVMDHGFLRQP